MSPNYLTLSRQGLYDLVWATPISQLASQFGITDVGLAKRCRNVDVPIPYRGYWARVAAGQTPAKTPLPKYRNSIPSTETAAAGAEPRARARPKEPMIKAGTEPTVRFGLGPGHVDAVPKPTAALSEIEQRIAKLDLGHDTTLAGACAVVRRTGKHHKLPGRGQLQLSAQERDGWIIDLDVTVDALSRALLLADRIIRG